MKKFTVKKVVQIKASKENVWKVLLTPEKFAIWGSAFCPDSRMEGDWKLGGQVTYTDNKGMGLRGKVVDFNPPNRVTVEYTAVLKNYKEARSEGKEWIGCQETYALIENEGITNLAIESEVPTKEYQDEFSSGWDKAISKIQGLAEPNQANN